MTPELLESVRNELSITWADTGTDNKLTGSITRGMARLNQLMPSPLDFSAEDLPRQLLFAYCFYDRSHALDDFEKNYLAQIQSLQHREEVREFVESQISVV